MGRMPSFAVSAVALSVAALGAVPAAAAAPRQSPAAYSCNAGYFCIYTGWNGTGTRCQWSQSKLANTADNCSFIQRGTPVRSLYNRTGHRVQYYTQTNYKHRVGSTPKNGKGNLQGNYQIRSFKPQ
ncbi:peptidase inhibitor family I36 protein [Streptomyces sp. NPDC004959]|uniref:peptidase inhibitor family I36 protein n=1 Tax=Streptomyces sp. NPDC004959 TaxID=3154673 RepID=UPI0033A7CC2C